MASCKESWLYFQVKMWYEDAFARNEDNFILNYVGYFTMGERETKTT